MKEMLSFTTICMASSSQSSFLYRLFIDPLSMVQVFVPFIPNTKYDFMYQKEFEVHGAFTRWKCANCETIFCIFNCGALHPEP